jgi:pimeloyl-ACP methyl ester carboxylesterase
MRDELTALSSDSGHVRAQEAGHYIHLDEPEPVIQATNDLVESCRASTAA